MNFISFPIGTTNIFPLVNSKTGGQLVTEFNLRSRESVDTDPNVKYIIGPSYTHSADDYALQVATDGMTGSSVSTSVLEILPGRALVNGHYVESLTSIYIDLNEANYVLSQNNKKPLKGKLKVGLRMMYSTLATVAGAALPEDPESGYFDGIQVVILPASEAKLPSEVPSELDQEKCNMHLLLGTISYINGTLKIVEQNENKWKSMDAQRIFNFDSILSNEYVSKRGLDPGNLYTMSGKPKDESGADGNWKNYWSESNGSLMIWDADSRNRLVDTRPATREAQFQVNPNKQTVDLVVPHKQIEGGVQSQVTGSTSSSNTNSKTQWFDDKRYSIPVADYVGGTPGVVNAEYTSYIKKIREDLNNIYNLPNGKLRMIIPSLSNREDLPDIPDTHFTMSYPIADDDTDWTALTDAMDNLFNSTDGLYDRFVEGVQNHSTRSVMEAIIGTTDSGNTLRANCTALLQAVPNLRNILIEFRDESQLSPNREVQDRIIKNCNELIISLESAYNNAQEIKNLGVLLIADFEGQEAYPNPDTAYVAHAESCEASLDQLSSSLTSSVNNRNVLNTFIDGVNATYYPVWELYDYVVVVSDATLNPASNGSYPSSLYFVVPGYVQPRLEYVEHLSLSVTGSTTEETIQGFLKSVPTELAEGSQLGNTYILSDAEFATVNLEGNVNFWDSGIRSQEYTGVAGVDYFVAQYEDTSSSTVVYHRYFYTPKYVSPKYMLDKNNPILITGGTPFATLTQVGGFLNVDPTSEGVAGRGYVYLDDTGHLVLADYNFLATGVFAGQLGEDHTIGSGMSIDVIQSNLNEYVNKRVASPGYAKWLQGDYIINIYLTIPTSSSEQELVFEDIDSRFGTIVYLHIQGTTNSNTTIKFVRCKHLRIDPSIQVTDNDPDNRVKFEFEDTELFYDADILQYATKVSGLSLWYKQMEETDPQIQVDGMTIRLASVLTSDDVLDPWSIYYQDDFRYMYALESLTFSSDGLIVGIGLAVGCNITANTGVPADGRSAIAAPFVLPQTSSIKYPPNKLTQQVKVTGSFVTCYRASESDSYTMLKTDFSAMPQLYQNIGVSNGSIAFLTEVYQVPDVTIAYPGGTTATSSSDVSSMIDCWENGRFHSFQGGLVSNYTLLGSGQ